MTAAFVPNFPIASQANPAAYSQGLQHSFLPNIMVDVERLPSRSLSYPKGAKIKFRPYTFGEVKQISQTPHVSDEEKFDFVLNGVEASFDKELITIADLLYIGVLRKVSTFGASQANVVVPCPCGQHIQHRFDIHTLEFKDLAAPDLPIYLDLTTGETLEFMPLTVAGFRQVVREKRQNDDIAWYAAMVNNKPFEDVYNIIMNTSVLDYESFQEVDQLLFHGLEPLTVKCHKCNTENKVELDEGAALIVPFRQPEGTTGSRIRYGKGTANKPHRFEPNGLRGS